MDKSQYAIDFFRMEIPIKFDNDGFIGFSYLKRITVSQPVVGDFYLLTIDNFLFKQTMLVMDTITMKG